MKLLSKTLTFNSKALATLLKILPSARLIGGCVRDALLGITGSDIDIAVPIAPQQVTKILKGHQIKVIPTGIDFGTVTAVIGGEVFEITSLRKDIDCDGRHAVVEYTENFEEDALRRDFTINALSYSVAEKTIYDYYDGLGDLEAKRVRFIGIASERIEEDCLRILRFFRFSAFYADKIDDEGYKACIKMKDSLSKLPRERINRELDKLLVERRAPEILSLMIDGGLDLMSGLIVSPITYVQELALPGIYAMMLRDNSLGDLKKILPSLRMPKRLTHQILDLLDFTCKYTSSRGVKRRSDPVSPGIVTSLRAPRDDIIQDLLEAWVDGKYAIQYMLFASFMNLIDNSKIDDLKKQFEQSPPMLPVNGNDLRRFFSGAAIGIRLSEIKKVWIASNFTMTKRELLR